MSDIHPPEILVEVRRIGSSVHPGRFLDPASGNHLCAVPLPPVQVEAPELGEVDRPAVEAALHLLEAVLLTIEAPRSVRLHPEGLPDLLRKVGGHGAVSGPLQYHAQQQWMVVVVFPPRFRLDFGLYRKCQSSEVRVVVGLCVIAERTPTATFA